MITINTSTPKRIYNIPITKGKSIVPKSGSMFFDKEDQSFLLPIAHKSRKSYSYSGFGGSSDPSKTLLAPGQTFSSVSDFVAAYPFTLEPILKLAAKKLNSLTGPVSPMPTYFALPSNLAPPGPQIASEFAFSATQRTYNNEGYPMNPANWITINPDGSPESDIIANAMSEYQPFTFSFQVVLPQGPAPHPLQLNAWYYSYWLQFIVPSSDPIATYPNGSHISSAYADAAYANRATIFQNWLPLIRNFNAYSQPTNTSFTEIYGVSDPSQLQPNTISYVVANDMPPAPDGGSFNPSPNTVDFWSMFFTFPEGRDFLSVAAQKGPRGFTVMDTTFSQVPSSINITDTPQLTRYAFMLGMNDFDIKTYPGNKIIVSYNRQTKNETIDVQKEKTSFVKYIAMAVGIAIITAMTMAIAAPAAFSSLVGAGAAAAPATTVSAAATAAESTTAAAMSATTPALTTAISGGGLASIGAAPTLGMFSVTAPVLTTTGAGFLGTGTLLSTLGGIGLTVAKTLGPQFLQGMMAPKPVIATVQPIPAPSTQAAPAPPSNAIALNSNTLAYAGQSSSGQFVYTIVLPNGNTLNVTLSRQLQPNEISSAYLTPIACNDDATKACYSFVVPNVVTINDNTYSAQSQPTQPQPSVGTTPVPQPSVIPYGTNQPTVLPYNYSNPSVLPSNYSQPSVIPYATQSNAQVPVTAPTAVQAGMLGGSLPLLLAGGIVIFLLFGRKSSTSGIIEKTPTTLKK